MPHQSTRRDLSTEVSRGTPKVGLTTPAQGTTPTTKPVPALAKVATRTERSSGMAAPPGQKRREGGPQWAISATLNISRGPRHQSTRPASQRLPNYSGDGAYQRAEEAEGHDVVKPMRCSRACRVPSTSAPKCP